MIKNYKNFIKESVEIRDINWFIKENNIALDVTELDCTHYSLINLHGIEKLTRLTILNCGNNKLTNLHGVENLTNLTKLICYDNNLTNLHGIENLTNLTSLNCPSNRLTNLYEIENLTNLIGLDCSYNKLTSLHGIENCTNLIILRCYDNNLTNLHGIEKLYKLTELNCVYNELTSLLSIKKLLDNSLAKLHFRGNNLPHYSTDIRVLKQQLDLEKYNYGIAEQALEMCAPIIDGTNDKWYELSKIEKPFVVTKDGKKIDILDIKLIDEGEEL